MHRNALIYKRKIFLLTVETRPSSRQNFSLLISKGNSRDLDSARIRPLSTTIGQFLSVSPRPSETRKLKKDRHEALITQAHGRTALASR